MKINHMKISRFTASPGEYPEQNRMLINRVTYWYNTKYYWGSLACKVDISLFDDAEFYLFMRKKAFWFPQCLHVHRCM